jgi:oxygen-dependent protoporphyrinogen oxidase
MQTLTNALEKSLPDGSVFLNEEVAEICGNQESWEIQTDSRKIEAQGVIITTPSYNAATLVKNMDPGLSSDLSTIEFASSAVVISAFKNDQISRELKGFGFVVPDDEKRDLIACSFSSIKFDGRAPEDSTILRAFLGGALKPGVCELSDDQIVEKARRELYEILGISGHPEFTLIQRYKRAMPQYHVGHLDIIERIKKRAANYRGLELAGNAYNGVGIPECVHSGETASESIIKDLFD